MSKSSGKLLKKKALTVKEVINLPIIKIDGKVSSRLYLDDLLKELGIQVIQVIFEGIVKDPGRVKQLINTRYFNTFQYIDTGGRHVSIRYKGGAAILNSFYTMDPEKINVLMYQEPKPTATLYTLEGLFQKGRRQI